MESEPAHVEAAHAEAVHAQDVHNAAIDPEVSHNEETVPEIIHPGHVHSEAVHPDPIHTEAIHHEDTDDESIYEESVHSEDVNHEEVHEEAHQDDDSHFEGVYHEEVHAEAVHPEEDHAIEDEDEAAHPDTHPEDDHHEAVHQETMHHDTAQLETLHPETIDPQTLLLDPVHSEVAHAEASQDYQWDENVLPDENFEEEDFDMDDEPHSSQIPYESLALEPDHIPNSNHHIPYENYIFSPEIHINNEPAHTHTDSMYTVRLSEPDSEPPAFDDHSETASITSDRTVEPPHIQRLDSFDIIHGNIPHEGGERNLAAQHESMDPKSATAYHSFQEEDVFEDASLEERRSRSDSNSSRHSDGSGEVDWARLEKTENAETRDEVSDESTAFLLARLEQANDALATNPKFNALRGRPRKQSRPPSMQVLRKLVNDPSGPSSRYSVLPSSPPPMTELEFWAALVKDYHQTAQRLPTLTSNKIKAGVPPPLRGVVWTSMVGARDSELGNQFDRLCLETSPYENLIGKDVGRSFPGVEMFRDPQGEGQLMLGRVLRCFSLYDKEIGYCQGLGFLVGPLLMQMGDKDAFCILVKLMENYDLRSCFLPSLSGLHVRIYQFQRLLDQHMPVLAAHLASLQVEAAYLSQWFLSFFAVTCPLPMLFRIYDVIFAEGASETIMRVALSLMRRNEKKIMASKEFEEVMQLLLSRSLWEAYAYDPDELVNDFMEMTGLVTLESLKTLEMAFKMQHGAEAAQWFAFLPEATAAASRFLGRVWTASTPVKGVNLSVSYPTNSRPGSFLRRSPSKQSIAASINSTEISSEGAISASTDATMLSRQSGDVFSVTSKADSLPVHGAVSKEDKDLHSQIEDLLTALSDMQRQHGVLTAQIQREREERSEDFQAIEELLYQLKPREGNDVQPRPRSLQQRSENQENQETPMEDRRKTMAPQKARPKSASGPSLPPELQAAMERADGRMTLYRSLQNSRSSDLLETKQRLRDSLIRSRGQLDTEMSRSAALTHQLDQQEKETLQVRETLRQAQARLQEELREKQRLEETIQSLRDGRSPASFDSRRGSMVWPMEAPERPAFNERPSFNTRRTSTMLTGLRELKLSRTGTSPDFVSPMLSPGGERSGEYPSLSPGTGTGNGARGGYIPKRGSSLAMQSILATEDHAPASEDELLVELVAAKTAEAMARTELEEVKGKLDAMRRMLGVPTPPAGTPTMTRQVSGGIGSVGGLTPPAGAGASAGAGAAVAALGGFWGWGKRSVSPSGPPVGGG